MTLDSETLEYAAKILEGRAGNAVYRQAWRTAAKHLRALKGKMLMDEPQKLISEEPQISNSSSRPVA